MRRNRNEVKSLIDAAERPDCNTSRERERIEERRSNNTNEQSRRSKARDAKRARENRSSMQEKLQHQPAAEKFHIITAHGRKHETYVSLGRVQRVAGGEESSRSSYFERKRPVRQSRGREGHIDCGRQRRRIIFIPLQLDSSGYRTLAKCQYFASIAVQCFGAEIK